ncbi:hypothetical protein I4F81_003789 [Pyropia yezoensis]|uniref:Uncharacterized protein n=1 Tax=Pyropia yezoensis TaxID=2788 RepID=A0ACC3BTK5_PYRYE|nr:hypothetical protein I4F81_003789 [Neopyropia yezoensis]
MPHRRHHHKPRQPRQRRVADGRGPPVGPPIPRDGLAAGARASPPPCRVVRLDTVAPDWRVGSGPPPLHAREWPAASRRNRFGWGGGGLGGVGGWGGWVGRAPTPSPLPSRPLWMPRLAGSPRNLGDDQTATTLRRHPWGCAACGCVLRGDAGGSPGCGRVEGAAVARVTPPPPPPPPYPPPRRRGSLTWWAPPVGALGASGRDGTASCRRQRTPPMPPSPRTRRPLDTPATPAATAAAAALWRGCLAPLGPLCRADIPLPHRPCHCRRPAVDDGVEPLAPPFPCSPSFPCRSWPPPQWWRQQLLLLQLLLRRRLPMLPTQTP